MRTHHTNDIKIRRVNCYYTTITPTTPVYIKTDYVRDVGLAYNPNPIIYDFIHLKTDHP